VPAAKGTEDFPSQHSLDIPVASEDSLTPSVALTVPPPPLNLFIPVFQLLQCCVVGNTAIPLGTENVFRQ